MLLQETSTVVLTARGTDWELQNPSPCLRGSPHSSFMRHWRRPSLQECHYQSGNEAAWFYFPLQIMMAHSGLRAGASNLPFSFSGHISENPFLAPDLRPFWALGSRMGTEMWHFVVQWTQDVTLAVRFLQQKNIISWRGKGMKDWGYFLQDGHLIPSFTGNLNW